MDRQYFVYIMTNRQDSVLYVGVTNDLIKRVYEHKAKWTGGFSKKYSVDKLVYYEIFEDIIGAISREKQLKAGRRNRKVGLIDTFAAPNHDFQIGVKSAVQYQP